jgi:hypothetical protein
VLSLLFVVVSLAAYAVNESDLLPVNEAFPLTVSVGGPQQVTLDFSTREATLPENYVRKIEAIASTVDPLPWRTEKELRVYSAV